MSTASDTRLKELSQDATVCCRSAGLHPSLPPLSLPPSLSVCLSHAQAAMWAARVGIWLPLDLWLSLQSTVPLVSHPEGTQEGGDEGGEKRIVTPSSAV